jgi:hypothetical protein
VRKRALVSWAKESFAITRGRACGLMMLERSSFYYRAHPRDNRALEVRLKELAAVRVRYGYRRLTILLRREGWGGECQAGLPHLSAGLLMCPPIGVRSGESVLPRGEV